MKCIFCESTESKVVDSRAFENNTVIKRRRECLGCGKKFTTLETAELSPIMVIKSDGNRQAFDPNKIRKGIVIACEKRHVSMDKINKLVDDIHKQLANSLEQEISSKKIGEMVMAGLKEIDDVAYVRFASVYRQFNDLSSFMNELEKLIKK